MEHFVEDYSKGPYIDFDTVVVFLQDLGSHGVEGAQTGATAHLHDVWEDFGHAHIANFEDPIINKDILGLEVSVDDLIPMQLLP